MKQKGIIVLLTFLFTACTDVPREQQAAEAARQYFEVLAKGDAEHFLEGKVNVDSLPEDYRRQLLTAVRQYVDVMHQKHGGLHQVSLSSNAPVADTLLDEPYVRAFLLLSYNDSTQEEVVVPMVERDGRWLMK